MSRCNVKMRAHPPHSVSNTCGHPLGVDHGPSAELVGAGSAGQHRHPGVAVHLGVAASQHTAELHTAPWNNHYTVLSTQYVTDTYDMAAWESGLL